FTSARVMRVCDANPLHLGHLHRADGRWRIYVFASPDAALLAETASRLEAVIGDHAEWFDVQVVYPQNSLEVDLMAVPAPFTPRVGPFDLTDLENVFATLPDDDVFDARGISRDGVIVVVRPDHYVAQVLPLDAAADLAGFFGGA